MYLSTEENKKIVNLINENGCATGKVSVILDKLKLGEGCFAVLFINELPPTKVSDIGEYSGELGAIIIDWKVGECGACNHTSAGELLAEKLRNGEF